jgi:hypothetical protein
MTFNVFDMRGEEIVEDDVVVCSFSAGSSAYLRIGRVQEKKVTTKNIFDPADSRRFYLKIRWSEGTGRVPDKPTLIAVEPNTKSHLLKVDLDGIN